MKSEVQMVFWDVQHGHATYIKTPNGKHIVIDLGIGSYDDKNEKFSPLLHLKDQWKVKQLDYVIITHPHLDHIDDILNFDLLKPKMLSRPKHITNKIIQERNRDCPSSVKKKYDKYCNISDRYNTKIQKDGFCNIGGLDDWGGVKISTFFPTTCKLDNFNNYSILTVIEYAGMKVVIPGDNEICSLNELMQNTIFKAAVKNAEILLAPHHGRASAYHNGFVTLVNPKLTIVSDGSICDTSANARYSVKSRGLAVYKKKDKASRTRRCLTTNTDGEIFVKFGIDSQRKKYLNVFVK